MVIDHVTYIPPPPPFLHGRISHIVPLCPCSSFFLHHREAVLAIASNFNHACHARRNVQYWWDDRRRVMVFTATEGPVARGEELLISYGEFRDALFEKFGFVCRCGACEGEPWEAAPSQLDF